MALPLWPGQVSTVWKSRRASSPTMFSVCRHIVPIGRFLFTDKFYQQSLAPFADVTDNKEPSSGPLWVKTMGVDSGRRGRPMVCRR